MFFEMTILKWTKCLEKIRHDISAQTSQSNCLHSIGGVMVWVCFATTGYDHVAVIKSTMNSSVYQSIVM